MSKGRTIKDPPAGPSNFTKEEIRDVVERVKESREAPSLTRTRSVLDLDTEMGDPNSVYFISLDEEANARDVSRPFVQLARDQWRDMGDPERITIAIWPGDRQDLMEQEDFPE